MKIGLYFGSFNPVHIGHLIVANYILNETDLKKIWFIISPQNPFKAETNLLNEYHRLAIENSFAVGYRSSFQPGDPSSDPPTRVAGARDPSGQPNAGTLENHVIRNRFRRETPQILALGAGNIRGPREPESGMAVIK